MYIQPLSVNSPGSVITQSLSSLQSGGAQAPGVAGAPASGATGAIQALLTFATQAAGSAGGAESAQAAQELRNLLVLLLLLTLMTMTDQMAQQPAPGGPSGNRGLSQNSEASLTLWSASSSQTQVVQTSVYGSVSIGGESPATQNGGCTPPGGSLDVVG